MIVLSALRTSPSFERGVNVGVGDVDFDELHAVELDAVECVCRGQLRGARCPAPKLLPVSSTTGSNVAGDERPTSVEMPPGQHARIDADSMTISRPIDTWACRDGREFPRKYVPAATGLQSEIIVRTYSRTYPDI